MVRIYVVVYVEIPQQDDVFLKYPVSFIKYMHIYVYHIFMQLVSVKCFVLDKEFIRHKYLFDITAGTHGCITQCPVAYIPLRMRYT